MTDKVKKILLFTSIGVLSLGAIGTGVGFSLAGFAGIERVPQRIGSGGLFNQTKKTIFLNPKGRDDSDWTHDSDVFYMYVFKRVRNQQGKDDDSNGTWISHSTTVDKGTAHMYVFIFDQSHFTHFLFTRMNPDSDSLPSWEAKWTQTGDISFSDYSSKNYFVVTTRYDQDGASSHCKCNSLSSSLNWESSDQDVTYSVKVE